MNILCGETLQEMESLQQQKSIIALSLLNIKMAKS